MLGSTRKGLPRFFCTAAAALLLPACGGPDGFTGVASTPPPPVAPPAPPTVAMTAPARATMPPASPEIFASAEGPNFTNGGAVGTTFPLLQTSLILDIGSVGPDASVNQAGGTAAVSSGGLSVNINNVSGPPSYMDGFDWTRIGWWETFEPEGPWDYGGDIAHRGAWVAGYETPTGDMSTTGTATYAGVANGLMYVPITTTDALPCKCQEVPVTGDAFLTANFGARSVTGELTNMVRVWWDESAWNNVTFTSTIAGNAFSGTTNVTAGVDLGMRANATGTVEGRFFGPSAAETGAVWTLFDGTNSAIGTLAGKRN